MSYFFLSFYLIPTPVKMPLKTPPPMPTATRLPLNTFMLDGLRTEFNSFSKRRRNIEWWIRWLQACNMWRRVPFSFCRTVYWVHYRLHYADVYMAFGCWSTGGTGVVTIVVVDYCYYSCCFYFFIFVWFKKSFTQYAVVLVSIP